MIECVRLRNDFGKNDVIDYLWRFVDDTETCSFDVEFYDLSPGFMNNINGNVCFSSDFIFKPVTYL